MPKIILIVDDDPDILASTKSILEKREFHVLTAHDAETALGMLKTEHPDLVITDVLLPLMNGYNFVKQVKAGVFTSDIPILVMTGRGQMKESFDVVGVEGFIQKPFSPEELLKKIYEIIDLTLITKDETRRDFKKFIALGRKGACDMLNDIEHVVAQFSGQVMRTYAVPDAIAKAIEWDPDAFIVDVQLDGKPCAEFVTIVRRLPRCATQPIIGFCYYKVADLGFDECRKQVACIQDDADKFLKSGGDFYIGRYSNDGLIAALKEVMTRE